MNRRQQKGAFQGAFSNMVRVAGLEPARLTPADFKSAVYTNSTTLACSISLLRYIKQLKASYIKPLGATNQWRKIEASL